MLMEQLFRRNRAAFTYIIKLLPYSIGYMQLCMYVLEATTTEKKPVDDAFLNDFARVDNFEIA